MPVTTPPKRAKGSLINPPPQPISRILKLFKKLFLSLV